MKTKIYKYILERKIGEPQEVQLPLNRQFLKAECFNGEICLWFLVADEAYTSPARFIIYYTGDTAEAFKYCATVIDHSLKVVYHIFLL